MPLKQWTMQHGGHEIRVVNTWTGGTRLYIDGELRDRNSGLYAPEWTWWLSARLRRDDPTSDLVEVYVVAVLKVKAQIRVNGQYAGGDRPS